MTKGNFKAEHGTYAIGSAYGPLLTDGHEYLCPDCGGYGTMPTSCDKYEGALCEFCDGNGVISLHDLRVLVGWTRTAEGVEDTCGDALDDP